MIVENSVQKILTSGKLSTCFDEVENLSTKQPDLKMVLQTGLSIYQVVDN
jgi:hypothetical protein